MKKVEENHSASPIILNLVFCTFILFLASIPWLYGYITEADIYITLSIVGGITSISFFISLYWLYLLDLSLKVNGSKEAVYKNLDLIQFKKMGYMNIGYKTRGVFLNGFVANRKMSQVFSERYDSFLLVFSICGTGLLFMGLGNPELNNNSILYHLLQSTVLRSVLSGLGGYMEIWSLSLYIMSLFCTFHNSRNKS